MFIPQCRPGVIKLSSLTPYIQQELLYGHATVDISYLEAYNERKAALEDIFDQRLEDAEIAASEVDGGMTQTDRENYILNFMREWCGTFDRDEYTTWGLDEFSETYADNRPVLEGVLGDTKYRITFVNDKAVVWVLHSLYPVRANDSAFAPGVGDLNDLQDYPEFPLSYSVPLTWRSLAN